jgi:hypothetical protein
MQSLPVLPCHPKFSDVLGWNADHDLYPIFACLIIDKEFGALAFAVEL